MFIVTIWNDKHRFTDTRRQLTSAGCANILPVNSLRWKFADQLLPALWEDLPHRLLERASAIRDGFRFWSDQQSRCEYVGHIRWRLHADFDALPAASLEESYFPSVLSLRDDEVLVDCGAFDGDTLRSFIRHQGGQFKKAFAFEPDPALYGKLQQWIATLKPTVRSKIDASPVAVGARRERLNFDSSAGTFVSDGALTVEAAPLDELLGDDVPTYIKMDIEGAEMDALAGARSALSRYRPALAVCVYHRPADLWNIPRYIHDVDSRYRLYLRSHDPDGWQTLCYAVPQERALGA
jgi:FkbM family methyltransferase